MKDLQLHHFTLDALEPLLALEQASYPPAEAATPARIRTRVSQANRFQLGASRDTCLVAYILATTTHSTALTEESMAVHEEGGRTLCIHSVVVSPDERGKRVGTWLLLRYLERLSAERVDRVRIIVHVEKICFYERVGFKSCGPSAVVHGDAKWVDMEYLVPAAS